MKRVTAIVAGALLAFSGCGYHDDNPDAARVVAQSLLDAQRAGDADAVCRLLGPSLLAYTASQAGGRCQPYVARSFEPGATAMRAGRVQGDDSRVRVIVDGQPETVIGVLKYGSIWRVEEASVLTPR